MRPSKLMALATVVALLAPSLALAEDDEPLIIKMEQGTVTPEGADGHDVHVGHGVYLDDTAAIHLAQVIKGVSAENEALKVQNQALVDSATGSPKLWMLAVAFALGGAACYGTFRLLGK